MTSTVEIAAAPTVDTPGTCLFVHTDKRAYVFGRPSEGTQRAFNSRKIGMGATEQVFLSGSIGWDQVGGLFGYLLTVGGSKGASKEQLIAQNAERKNKGMKALNQTLRDSIGVHGGENLCHSLAACRPLILRQPVTVETFEQRKDTRVEDPTKLEPDWEDDALRVWKVPVRRARSSSPQKRRRESDSEPSPNREAFKERNGASDPTLAALIVEKVMFNGSLRDSVALVPKMLSLVKPNDTVFLQENNQLSAYKGPFVGGSESVDPEKVVWVLPTKEDGLTTGTGSEAVQLTHRPLPATSHSRVGLSYIVKFHDRRGKFNPKAAKDLGVKPPDFKQLTSGQNVQGKDGITVTPNMVMGDSQPGKGFIVADIASPDFLDSFMDRPEWSTPELMKDIAVMYWILGPGMANDSQIQKFVKDNSQIKHIFCAEDACPNMIVLAGPGELQTRLRRIDPDRFTLLKYDNNTKTVLPQGSNAELGRIGNRVNLMPRLQFDTKDLAPFPNLLEAANSVTQEFLDLSAKAREETTNSEFLRKLEEDEKDIPSRDAEIIPLGTGSSIPGKYRNVSATLIRVPGIGNYLMDCGEGTLGQIRRLFGEEETASILRGLKCIIISHLHADHHLGTPSVLKAWYKETLDNNDAKLAISCIARYRSLLAEISQVEDIGFHRLRFVSCAHGRDIDLTTREDFGDENFGLNAIKRVLVPHCWRAYATEIELTSGLRIAYSGDCRPSEDFARACEGTHLLIHECTFDDDMESHAKKKRHSTMGDALGVARSMKARRVLLTHFSQRYVKEDSLKRQAADEEMVILMAYDHMRVKLGDWRAAAAYQPTIAKMLADKGDDKMEE